VSVRTLRYYDKMGLLVTQQALHFLDESVTDLDEPNLPVHNKLIFVKNKPHPDKAVICRAQLAAVILMLE
jgi:hypothetical protein